MPANPDAELARLRAQLDEVTRRESRYRLESVQDYLDLQARLRAQSATIGERGTYIHQLHLEQMAARAELQAAAADLEAYVWMLHEAERALERTRRRTVTGLLTAPWRALRGLFSSSDQSPADVRLPAGDFIYFLHTSPYRLYRGTSFTLRGWAFPRDGRAVTAVRVRLAGRAFAGRIGLPEPGAIAQHGPQPANPQPGFEIAFETPPGRHWLRLEACVEHREWFSILNAPIWCRPAGT